MNTTLTQEDLVFSSARAVIDRQPTTELQQYLPFINNLLGLFCIGNDVKEYTLLDLAIRANHVEAFKLLLERVIDVNAISPQGDALIHQVAKIGNVSMASLLLEKKADIHAISREVAPTMTRWLINLMPPHILNTYAPFGLITKKSDTDTVGSLLNNHCDLQSVNCECASTPLHLAVSKACFEMVQFLLDQGAGTEATDHCGYTALHQAVKKNNIKVVKLLLERGAAVNATVLCYYLVDSSFCQLVQPELDNQLAQWAWDAQYGDTSLHLAAAKGYFEMVELLIGRGANARAFNQYYQTPSQVARGRGYTQVAWFLEINEYITEKEQREKSFFFRFRSSYSKTVKLEAAKALLAVVSGKAERASLDLHRVALNNSRLSAIYKQFKGSIDQDIDIVSTVCPNLSIA